MVYIVTTFISPPLQDLLLYLVPAFSVVAGGIYAVLARWAGKQLDDRELSAEVRKAERHLRQIEADGNASAALKAEARERVESLRLLAISVHAKRVQTIVDDQ